MPAFDFYSFHKVSCYGRKAVGNRLSAHSVGVRIFWTKQKQPTTCCLHLQRDRRRVLSLSGKEPF